MQHNRNMNRDDSSHNFPPGGSFLTDHLQDIDLELDLLKRKREMLEQQQFIQPNQQSNFNQLPFYLLEPKQSGSNRDYSHSYNDASQGHRQQFNRKRQSDNDWHHNSYPKRSASQGQHSSNFAGPSPDRNQRPYTNQNKQAAKYKQGKQFIGHKHQRPEKKFVANKITKDKQVSQPVAAARKPGAKVKIRDPEAFRLLPDKEPTKQMTGRLELALGTILRDIREMCAKNSEDETLRFNELQRFIKQAVRERMRSAMLGKIVGTTQEIVKEYRDMYPQELDVEVMNIALEASGMKPEKKPEAIVLERDRPEEYFKASMIKLIESHLHEIFDKVEEIYNPKSSPKEDSIVCQDENNEKIGEKVEGTEEPEKKENVIEENIDNVEIAEREITANNEAAQNTENVEDILTYANEYKKMLPRLLKRHIPTILKRLQLNKKYRLDVGDIIRATRAKYRKCDATEQPSAIHTSEVSRVPYVWLPYYVKVMGKPQLPKKIIMKKFLEKFNPRSIKRHRSIHNLLFVGFTEKSDFDAIMDADGTAIGRSTLSIRVSDKSCKNLDVNATDQNEDVQNDSATDILGSELEDQITNLLNSIKKSEENNLNDTGESATQDEDECKESIGENADDETASDNVEVIENNEEQLIDTE